MKALTLWQPWASLIAVNAKTIETRSWSTKYRGSLAIHAAKRLMKGDTAALELWWANRDQLGSQATEGAVMPYGAVIAVCQLVDVVPILWMGEQSNLRRVEVCDSGALWLSEPDPDDTGEEATAEITDQRPYGDYTPGRYAWVLGGILPVFEPQPAKGAQGLWEYTP